MSQVIGVNLGFIRGTLGPGQRQQIKLKGVRKEKLPVFLIYTTAQHVLTKENLGIPDGCPECTLLICHPAILVVVDGRQHGAGEGLGWISDECEITIDVMNGADAIIPEPSQIGFKPGS